MMNLFLLSLPRSFAIVLLALTWFAVTSGTASAHGGLSLDEDMCKLTAGPYYLHFTGYQPDQSGSQEFCEDIPKTGQIIVTMDMIDTVLRTMPIGVRIIRDTGDESQIDAVTVLYQEPKLYPNGSVTFEHKFDQPGKFVGLVSVGEKGEYLSRFPFSVGIAGPNYMMYFWIVLVLALGYGLYLYSGRPKSAA